MAQNRRAVALGTGGAGGVFSEMVDGIGRGHVKSGLKIAGIHVPPILR